MSTNNSNKKALRLNEGKIDWTLLDFKSIEPLVEAMTYGATKYDRDNWKNLCEDPKQHIQSAFRHLIAIANGEEFDKESGKRHSGHVMANMMMYNYHTANRLERKPYVKDALVSFKHTDGTIVRYITIKDMINQYNLDRNLYNVVSGKAKTCKGWSILNEDEVILNPILDKLKSQLRENARLIEFNEVDHIYIYEGKTYPSVSTILHKYTSEFPADFVAPKVAAKRNREYFEENPYVEDTTLDFFDRIQPQGPHSTESILAEWDLKKNIGANMGSYVHYELEVYAANKYLPGKVVKELTIDNSFLTPDVLDRANKKIKLGKEWLDSMIAEGYILVDTEVMMLDKELGYCGTVDLLFLKGDKLYIGDWKSSKDEIYTDHYNNKMKAPFNHLEATTINKYKLQLSHYQELLQTITDLEIAGLIIVHLMDEEVKITNTEYLLN